MIILDDEESVRIRNKYIQSFIDTTSTYYVDKIRAQKRYTDGMCYTGYLWDCLLEKKVIPEQQGVQLLNKKRDIYLMWDIHSAQKILVPNYWKYPKKSVLLAKKWESDMMKELPEDLYLFDSSFLWSVVFTHETDLEGKRYCLWVIRSGDDKGTSSS